MHKKLKHICLLFLTLSCSYSFSQKSLSKLLKKYNTGRIPYIEAKDLSTKLDDVIILDARELPEYNTSHIKNAVHVGFNHFNPLETSIYLNNKNQDIVVYCTLGIRSEVVALQLKKMGYQNIYNLYGGIFEWKNNNLEVYNSEDQKTENIHAFSEEWSKWLTKGTKVYE